MRNILFTLLALVSVTSIALATDGDKKTVKTDASTINWTGKKVTGQHEGTIAIQSGELEFDGETLIGGNFVIDMTSLTTTDLSGGMADKLNGHLRSEDFFGVEAHPTATLTFTNVMKTDTGYKVTADLTIKNITHPITFEAVVAEGMAKADIAVDRTKYDVKYGSGKFFEGLGDKMIYDNFDLAVSLAF